jgi:hypothetical protein
MSLIDMYILYFRHLQSSVERDPERHESEPIYYVLS